MAAQDLPTEIWVEILRPLWPDELIAPCLVSRRLCSVAQPMLYRNPDLMADGSYPSSLHLFLRTLLTAGREHLASHVHELSLCWDCGALRSDDPDGPGFSAALARVGLPDGVLTGDVQVMLLLHLLPRLLVLDVVPPSHGDRFREFLDNHHALRPADTLPIGLRSLRHFTSRFYAPSRTALLALLSLPNIHTIEVPLSFWRSFSREQLHTASTMSSSVKALSFDCGRISAAPLTTLLGVPTALTHFRLTASPIPATFDFAPIALAIRQQRTTLTSLALDFLCRAPPPRPHTTPGLGPLHDFAALTHLACPLLALLDDSHAAFADVLPRGVRRLEVVFDDYTCVYDAVRAVMEMLPRKCRVAPWLAVVVVQRGRELDRKTRERLVHAGEAVGVRVLEKQWRCRRF